MKTRIKNNSYTPPLLLMSAVLLAFVLCSPLWGGSHDYVISNQLAAGKRHTVGLRSDHTVGLKSDGSVVAVGKNKHGQCDVGGWDLLPASD